ncbi:hypothetical protein BSL78_09762 [Apostichopus japonicus]|uniref:Uncharacterized protein n=1 Tax=Stichopus japonicus TaxID=307972 RepID=A0A2G8KZF0_STIJA|nr:hypothetical protein BSL78_09762 [Apostichopus japonicus]
MGNFWLAGGRDVNFQHDWRIFKRLNIPLVGWMGHPKDPNQLDQDRREAFCYSAEPNLQEPKENLIYGLEFFFDWKNITEPDYLLQSRQQNYPNYPASLGSDRPNTPPYGAPKRPSSPLEMTVK